MTEDTEQLETGQGAEADWAGAMAEQATAEQATAEPGADADWPDATAEQTGAVPEPDRALGIPDDAELPPGALSEESDTLPATPSVTPDNPAPASFEALGHGATARESGVNLDSVIEIPVTLQVEIGHARISIKDLLQLNQGSVVELDRLAGDPLDVLVNGTLVAHGEVVVVNERFGIRLTDVISARERVTKLG